MTATKVGWRENWSIPLLFWVASRVGILFVGYLSMTIVPAMIKPGGSPGLHIYPALDALCRWDCGWYDTLARRGYGAAVETNFWPGLPYATRWLNAATGLPVEFGVLLIPNLACLGAYGLIFRIFRDAAGAAVATTGLALFVGFPFSFFHAAGYPEMLMIFFSALAMRFAQKGRHASAGVSLGLGILSRHLTVFLGAGLLAAQVRERGWRRLLSSPRVLTLGFPFLVAGIFSLYCARVWHDPAAFWRARDAWGQTAWWSVVDVIRNVQSRPHIALQIPFALLPTLGALALLRRPTLAPELTGAVVPLIAAVWLIGAFAMGRYSASCWPAFLPLGLWLERWPRLKAPVLITLGLARGWFFFLNTHHYEIQ